MNGKIIERTNESVRGTLSKDCCFIFEALEQVASGSCCEQESDTICTWDLLPKIEEALLEHISFEEKWIFPKLKESNLQLHKMEHDNLLRLLALARWDLECGYGDQFRPIVSELTLALHEHHEHETILTSILNPSESEECRRDDNLLKIKERILAPWKETKAS